ncbi:MAG: hypothetical protein M9916_09115 [Crocinitomicaceae bacterium]|nr:hypothetical protein [Crocinitomicaceae bacterium]
MKKVNLLLFVAFLFVLGACTKYEEGPKVSLLTAKTRLVRHWVIETYEIDGVNQAINQNTSLEMDFYKDNTFKRTWVIFGFQAPEEGTWAFMDGKKKILLTKKDGGMELYTVVMLTKNELKAKFTDENNKTHAYYFKSK